MAIKSIRRLGGIICRSVTMPGLWSLVVSLCIMRLDYSWTILAKLPTRHLVRLWSVLNVLNYTGRAANTTSWQTLVSPQRTELYWRSFQHDILSQSDSGQSSMYWTILAELPTRHLDRLWSVLNVVTRMFYSGRRNEHALLSDLHCCKFSSGSSFILPFLFFPLPVLNSTSISWSAAYRCYWFSLSALICDLPATL